MNLLDWDQFMERVEQNEALALELAEDLLLCIDGRLEALVIASERAELKPIEHAAHALRGLVSSYGGQELLVILKAIEEQARSSQLTYTALPVEISKMVDQLKAEVETKLRSFRPGASMKLQEQPFI